MATHILVGVMFGVLFCFFLCLWFSLCSSSAFAAVTRDSRGRKLANVTKFGFTKRSSVEVSKPKQPHQCSKHCSLTFCVNIPTFQVFEGKTFCTRCINSRTSVIVALISVNFTP